jgi:uncharacterized membrane protein
LKLKSLPPILLSIFFILAGLNHFLKPDFYVAMIPPYLPAPKILNIISGAAEIVGGVGVLFPQTRRYAGVGLIALLIAVFPANLHMAINEIKPPGIDDFEPWMAWARLPFQLVFLFWVYIVTLKKK